MSQVVVAMVTRSVISSSEQFSAVQPVEMITILFLVSPFMLVVSKQYHVGTLRTYWGKIYPIICTTVDWKLSCLWCERYKKYMCVTWESFLHMNMHYVTGPEEGVCWGECICNTCESWIPSYIIYVYWYMYNDKQCGKRKKYVGLANLQSFVFAVLRCYFYL